MLLLDTNSVGYSTRKAYPDKKLDYNSFMNFLVDQYVVDEINVYIDEGAGSFLKYFSNNIILSDRAIDYYIKTKRPTKRKLKGEHVYCLSFAVDMALDIKPKSKVIIVSTDPEVESICKKYPEQIIVFGVGLPIGLRQHCTWHNIPETFLI